VGHHSRHHRSQAGGRVADGERGAITDHCGEFHDAIYVHDFEGNIIDVNENACRLVGYDRDELVGSNLSMIDSGWRPDPGNIHAEGHKSVHDDLERLLRDGAAVFERRNICRDGSVPLK
jgi:PAS domain S-box-containing protein